MIDIPNYSRATNMAYETLIEYHKFDLPINIFSVLHSMKNVAIHKYSETAQRFNLSFEKFHKLASSDYGFSIKNINKNRYEIFYNDYKSDTTIRFTLAHELGHIVLEHNKDGYKENKEANCFARNYLCPIPIVIGMNIESVLDYTDAFFVSPLMAETAIHFKQMDYENITSANFSYYNEKILSHLYGISFTDLYGYPV